MLHALRDNPLFQYLIELEDRRLACIRACAPYRDYYWQGYIAVCIIALWAFDYFIPYSVSRGFSSVLIILTGPIAILSGPLASGLRTRYEAVRHYPSPLDIRNPSDLLLATPLSGSEITYGTIGAYIRFPFAGLTLPTLLMVLINFSLIALVSYESYIRGTFHMDVLNIALVLYLPTLCIFIFLPVIAALDLLISFAGELRRIPGLVESARPALMSGWLVTWVALIALVPVMAGIPGAGTSADSLRWVIKTACPVILVCVGLFTTGLTLFVPGYLERKRRMG